MWVPVSFFLFHLLDNLARYTRCLREFACVCVRASQWQISKFLWIQSLLLPLPDLLLSTQYYYIIILSTVLARAYWEWVTDTLDWVASHQSANHSKLCEVKWLSTRSSAMEMPYSDFGNQENDNVIVYPATKFMQPQEDHIKERVGEIRSPPFSRTYRTEETIIPESSFTNFGYSREYQEKIAKSGGAFHQDPKQTTENYVPSTEGARTSRNYSFSSKFLLFEPKLSPEIMHIFYSLHFFQKWNQIKIIISIFNNYY